MRALARRISMLVLLPGLLQAKGIDVDAAISACPGGQQWLAQEQAEAPMPATDVAASDPLLRAELLKMATQDQAVREAMVAGSSLTPEQVKQWQAVDQHNLQRLHQIVDSQGFPDSSQVGYDGVGAAWLLLQHADRDPEFQARMLVVLGQRNDPAIRKDQLALLTDRVLIAQGKPQRYGSQYLDVGTSGVRMQAVESPETLDQRRASMGLPPSATYECIVKSVYAPAAKTATSATSTE